MIIKRGQFVPGLTRFVRQTRYVMAKRMREQFMVETEKDNGWDHGSAGDWLVHIGGELWSAISDSEFKKIYRRAEEDLFCTGASCPGADRRSDTGDRRAK